MYDIVITYTSRFTQLESGAQVTFIFLGNIKHEFSAIGFSSLVMTDSCIKTVIDLFTTTFGGKFLQIVFLLANSHNRHSGKMSAHARHQ